MFNIVSVSLCQSAKCAPRCENNIATAIKFFWLYVYVLYTLPVYTLSCVHTLYVLYIECLIGGVPRMGPRVPFALLPLDIFIQ